MSSAVTDASFDKVLQASSPYVVMLWRQGCPPCKELVPVLMEVAKKMPSVQFTLMNSSDNPKTSARFGVMACPALLVFRDGQMLGRWLGYQPEEKVLAWIKRTLGDKE